MKNTTELRDELNKVYQDLKSNKIGVDQAKAFVAITNSMIKSVQKEAEYNKFLGEKAPIDFLKTPPKDKK